MRIAYRWHDHVYTVIAWSAGVACGDRLSFDRCGQLMDKAQDRTIQQAAFE